jgi:hypothetical protein
VLLDVFLGDKANTTFPAWRRVVKDVEDLQLGFMDVAKFLEVILEENVLFVDVGINEGDGGGVERISECSTHDLDHWCDAGTTSDHAEVASHTGLVTEVALGTFDADSAAELELRNVLGDIALFISLEGQYESCATQDWQKRSYFDEEVKMAAVIIIADRGITAGNHFTVNLGRDGYVLSDGKAENILRVRELETIPKEGNVK